MRTMKISRIGVLSLAQIQALTPAFFGAIMVIGLVALQQAVPGGPNPSGIAGAGLVAGLAMIVLLPRLGGFIGGALSALIDHLAAGSVGGLEIDVEGPPSGAPLLTKAY